MTIVWTASPDIKHVAQWGAARYAEQYAEGGMARGRLFELWWNAGGDIVQGADKWACVDLTETIDNSHMSKMKDLNFLFLCLLSFYFYSFLPK